MKKAVLVETTQPTASAKTSGSIPAHQKVAIAWKGALVCCAIAYVMCILTTIAPLYKMVGIQTGLWISNAILKAAGWLHLPADLGMAANHYVSQQQTSYLEFLLLMLFAFTISGLCAFLLQRGIQDDYTFVLCLIWLTILVSGCLYLFTPATFSDDVYSYANYGRLLSVHHVNPYVVSPSAYPQDPTYHLVHWKETVSIYGPVWTVISAVVGLVSGSDRLGYLIAFRLCTFAAHLLNIWLVMTTLRTMGRSTRTIALGTLLYAWNPLVLFESSLGGHNDVFMLTFILLGLLFSVRAEHSSATRLRDAVPALVAFTLAALVKLTAIPIIVFFILKLFWNTYDTTASTAGTGKRDRAGRWRAALSIALFASTISISIALIGYAPFWLGHSLRDIVASFSSQPTAHYQFNSILAAMSVWNSAHGLPMFLAPFNSRSAWNAITIIVIALTMGIGAMWLRRLPTTRTVVLAALACLATFLLVTPWFLSWYVTGLVGLAAVCLPEEHDRPGCALFVLALTFSASAFLSYYYVSIAWILPHYVTSYVAVCIATFGIPLLASLIYLAFPRGNRLAHS